MMLLSDYILELFGKLRKISESLGNRHSKKNASGRLYLEGMPHMANRGHIGPSKRFLTPRRPMIISRGLVELVAVCGGCGS